jgi:hypothetical protein
VKRSTLSYFKNSLLVTLLGFILAALVGLYFSGTWAGALTMLFLCFVLTILEVSVSFDNAVVNATVLRHMTPVWRARFLTWGILIAVFGMRFVFPLAIVGIIGSMGPIDALLLAAQRPEEYAAMMLSSHVVLSSFGGAFLLMVALKYFFDEGKDIHWINVIEKPLIRLGKIEAVEIGLTLLVLYFNMKFLPQDVRHDFFIAGMFGILTFIAVDGMSAFLEAPKETQAALQTGGFSMFLYLEVLDTSFSFDGVIGAFAITNNLFIIAIGLGVGAMFVRSLTIYLVEKGALAKFRYLEHGAFYALGALAALMFIGTHRHVPEVITGLVGAGFIGLSFWASIQHNKAHPSEG